MEKLILLPGWGMDSNVWRPVIHRLSEHFELIHCDWYQLNSVEEYNASVLHLIDENVDGPFSMLGWSLGSLLAMKIASRYNDRLKHLIFVSGTSKFTLDRKSGYTCGWTKNIVEKMKTALLHDKQKTLDAFYHSMFSEEETQKGYNKRFTVDMNLTGRKYDTQELLTGLDFLIQTDCRENISQIKAPILMIHGEKDAICPIAAARYIATKLNTEVFLKTMKGAGHIPFYTHAEDFFSILKCFIERG